MESHHGCTPDVKSLAEKYEIASLNNQAYDVMQSPCALGELRRFRKMTDAVLQKRLSWQIESENSQKCREYLRESTNELMRAIRIIATISSSGRILFEAQTSGGSSAVPRLPPKANYPEDAILDYEYGADQPPSFTQQTPTEDADVAFRTSGAALVDVFYALEDAVSDTTFEEVLNKAWQDDPQATLKIIGNTRSIHLSARPRSTFHRALGWLAENHPRTFLTNVLYFVGPLIQKKAPEKEEKAGEVAEEAEPNAGAYRRSSRRGRGQRRNDAYWSEYNATGDAVSSDAYRR